jgi:flavin reductase (DIM6/NTAB) family NADH-FMN oxidoreductase RutF
MAVDDRPARVTQRMLQVDPSYPERGRTGCSPARCGWQARIMTDVAGFEALAAMLDYPMFVVTVAVEGERAGCLVGFTTQVSINPPRFLVCLSVKNHTFGVASRADRLAVHLLGKDEHRLAEVFGEQTGDVVDKFAQVRWHPGTGGVPLLDGAAAYFVGDIVATAEFGDHVGFVLEPEAAGVIDDSDEPISFEDVQDLEAGHEA